MEKFPKLQKMLVAALNQASLDGGMLLGHELAVKETEGATTMKPEYMKRMEGASFVVGVKSMEEYDGTFYMVFSRCLLLDRNGPTNPLIARQW